MVDEIHKCISLFLKILKDEEQLEMKTLNEIKRPKISLLHLVTIFCLLTFGVVETAQAQTQTFAQFNQSTAGNNFFFTNNAGMSGTLSTLAGGTPVEFTYLGIPGLDPQLLGNQCARIFIDSSTTTPATPAAPPSGYTQRFQTVIIQILRCFPATVGSGARNNLLTVVATQTQPVTTGPALTGNLGTQSAGLIASTPNESIQFSSDFLNFAGTTERNFALSFSSVTPPLTLGPGGFFSTFSAAGTGTFASAPRPVICCVTTAASVSVSGRVITPFGRGLNGAIVTLTEADGTVHTARTSTFGYYRFADISVGQTVTVGVASKRYNFQPALLNLAEDVQDLNLLSEGPR